MPDLAVYDAYADWYEEYITRTVADSFTVRVQRLLGELLGRRSGLGSLCLEVCCGTGAHAATLRELGWHPAGIDLSRGLLRYGARRLPVAVGDAAALPVTDRSVPAVVCVLAHTDVPDYAAVLREVARVLQPGGHFVHVGVHPCFCGAFADWSGRPRVVVDERYADRSHTFDAWNPNGVRARVGAWHVPLADLVNGVVEAGLQVEQVRESGQTGVPDVLGLLAVKPGGPGH